MTPSKPTPLVEQIAKEYWLKLADAYTPQEEQAVIQAAIEMAAENLKAKEQVLYDIHDALGIKWGDDPYQAIKQLREAAQPKPRLTIAEQIRRMEQATPRGERSEKPSICSAHAEREAGCPQCYPGAASGTPAVAGSEPPKEERGEPQEWTVDKSGKTETGEQFYSLMEGDRVVICGLSDFTPMADAHNAALAAERENLRLADATAQALRHQLLQAQAAIAETKKSIEPVALKRAGFEWPEAQRILNDLKAVDLSALEQERERVRKPLVDLLEIAWGVIANAGSGDWGLESEEWIKAATKWRDDWQAMVRAALASVKAKKDLQKGVAGKQ